ncbi:VOC family protein [Pusillimonas sp.]|uniref:VOC family protein n=1 Tax=Pusillimonas sp. TaxID=3040095 RepID=UPI0037CBB61B
MAKAVDLAKVIYQVPDLDLMEQTLLDFGLAPAERRESALFMRGTGAQHHIHETRLGPDARFIGAAFEVSSREDLDELAALPGSSPVQANDEPGGGWVVRMTSPDGFEINAVWGRERAELLPLRSPHSFNAGQIKTRVNASVRARPEPSPVIRLGHFVIHVSNHDETVAWLQERFKFLPSDHFAPPGQDSPIVGTFLRCNLGTQLVDHHCLLVLQADRVTVHHTSYEVQDLDSIMSAHDYLHSKGWQLDCGVGRHLLGSQIFDYWKDPFGFRIEHYTDGDVVDASYKPAIFNGTAQETTQWGMEPPSDFFM